MPGLVPNQDKTHVSALEEGPGTQQQQQHSKERDGKKKKRWTCFFEGESQFYSLILNLLYIISCNNDVAKSNALSRKQIHNR